MRKILVAALIFVLSFSTLSHAGNAATNSKYGPAVDWVNITNYEDSEHHFLNQAAIAIKSKNKNYGFDLKGLDKRVKYVNKFVWDITKSKPSSYNITGSYGELRGTIFKYKFNENEKTKKFHALVVFYDKNKKPIAHQEKDLTINKLDVKYNSSIKKLENKGNMSLDQTTFESLYIDLSNVDGEYWTFHASLKPLTVKDALKGQDMFKNYGITSFNPLEMYLYNESNNLKENSPFYVMILVYDKNLKPISYISETLNSSDFK